MILERCLDPDPLGRYRRALELAEDLDRWRTDRPLAYADEPFWGQAVPRWLRAQRRGLSIALATILTLALATSALVQAVRDRMNRIELAAKLERKWDDPDSGAFLRSQRKATPHGWSPSDPQAFEVAHRALLDYGLIGPGGGAATGDWRARDDVRLLPEADRADLEVWLMERAYRYAVARVVPPGRPMTVNGR